MLSDRSLICLPVDLRRRTGTVQSPIVPWFGPGAGITILRTSGRTLIVTEYGRAELEGKTVRERG